jgi:hypothetical protein
MASGDSTEFTAKITVDSKQAEKNVEDLGDQTEDTAEKFVSLKSQIRETTVALQKLETEGKTTGKEFEKLRAKLDDLNDAQDRASFKAGQFDDKLAAMPGVLGQAGGALKSFNDSVNQFGKTLTYSLGIVGLIVSGFLLLKESLESTAEGQALLTRVSSAFQKVLGPLLAIVEKVAVPVFKALATGLEAVARGFASAAEFIGISSDKIKQASSGVKDFKKQAEDLAKAEKERADKAKADADALKAKQDAAKEAARAKQKQIDDEAAKIQTEAALSLLDERAREIKERELRYAEEKKTILASNNKDLTNLNKEYQLDKFNIDKKYADEAEKKQIEKAQKDLKDLQDETAGLDSEYKKQDELVAARAAYKRFEDFNTLQSEIETLAASNLARENDFQADIARNELAQEKLMQQMQIELEAATLKNVTDEALLKAAEIKKYEIRKKYGDLYGQLEKDNTAIIKAEMQARTDIQLKYADVVGQLGSVLQQAAGDNKGLAIAGLIIEQAAGVAKIIINTQVAAAKAGYFTPIGIATLVSGALSVASAVMATVKGIQQINAVQVPGGSGGGGGGGMSAPSIQAPRVGTAAEPQMAEGVGANPSSQIAQTIGNASAQPVRAYVVSQDITSQQMLDRKSNQAAVF